MKTGILTFHASHNYGSMLQAYALQRILMEMGVKGKIINFRTNLQRELIPPTLQWKHPRSSLRKFISDPSGTMALQRKFNRFEKFLKRDLHLTPLLRDHDEVEQHIRSQKYDTLIVGSDQIWNTACWDFDKSYLLDFPLNIKRIAYAPSLGSFPEKLAENSRSMLREAWMKFDALSTREKRGSDFVERLTGRKTEVVLDPTLLLGKDSYAPLRTGKALVPEPYIFYYTPREEVGTFRIARLLAEALAMKIVVTQAHPEYIGENIIRKYDCGPREFLNIVDRASYTIGKSFHLLAFSLIFKKNFLMVSKDRDSRMMNILEPLGLCDRLISPDMKKLSVPREIDFYDTETKLIELRKSSLDYLRASLLL